MQKCGSIARRPTCGFFASMALYRNPANCDQNMLAASRKLSLPVHGIGDAI